MTKKKQSEMIKGSDIPGEVALLDAGLETIDDVLKKEDLQQIDGIGEVTAKEISQFLNQEEPQLYVILKRIKYKAFVEGEEPEYIDPHEDPYAPDAPRRTFDHLPAQMLELLLLKKVIAPDKK